MLSFLRTLCQRRFGIAQKRRAPRALAEIVKSISSKGLMAFEPPCGIFESRASVRQILHRWVFIARAVKMMYKPRAFWSGS